jgi:peptidoglycan hydrolase CwlO-like protein
MSRIASPTVPNQGPTALNQGIDVQPIDRLEEKVRQLVSMIDTLRAERAQALDEAARLQHELDAAKLRIAEAATTAAEAATLREERELVRTRVAQMIAQIDKLNL